MNKLVEEKKKELVNEFLNWMDEETMPWKKGWKMVFHRNIATGKMYKGINQLILMLVSSKFAYTSEYWGTFTQYQKKNIKLNKGSKGSKIIYYSWFDKEEKENINYSEVQKRIENGREKDEFRPVTKLYNVFNYSSTDKYERLENDKNDVSLIDSYLKKSGVSVKFGGNTACYIPSLNEIHLPNREQFIDDDEYYSTLLHEVAHSTIKEVERYSPSDLDEKEAYAFEELVAEISSVFLCCGFEKELKSIQNNKSYIKSWAKEIKKNNDYLYKAISSAEKVANHVLNC